MARFDDAIDLAQFAPSYSPSSGRNLAYPKADGQWYTKDSSGVENLIGSKLVPTPTISTDSSNKSYTDAQIAAMATVGNEMGYAERTTNFTTTNTTLWNLFSTAIISSLSVLVTGTGRQVEIEFYCPAMLHSANFIVSSYLCVAVGAGAAATNDWKLCVHELDYYWRTGRFDEEKARPSQWNQIYLYCWYSWSWNQN